MVLGSITTKMEISIVEIGGQTRKMVKGCIFTNEAMKSMMGKAISKL